MVTIKICGVRDAAAARACADARVDLVGLNFVAGRRRAITPTLAAELVGELAGIDVVGVFLDAAVEDIKAIATQVNLQWIQLHGSEPPSICAQVAEHYRVIKAMPVDDDFDSARLAAYVPHVAAFLFDAPQAGGGRTFDWSRLDGVPRQRPYFVAGGLNPDNVAAAIAAVRPDGVDTASGVETDGAIDPARVHAFCAAVRSTP